MKKYKAAVIGLSHISQARAPKPSGMPAVQPLPRSHVAAYAMHPQTELVGACDLMPAAFERFNNTWRDVCPDTRLYTDYREMLAQEKPDIVSVITPDDKHADIVVNVADSGVKAIWCEKPIATTLADADRMIEAVERNGVAMTVSHTRRWMPIFHRVRDLVRDKTYGDLKLVTATSYYSRAMMFRNGTHLFDMLYFLADSEPEWVIGELEDGFDGFDRYQGDGGNLISSEPSANAYIKFKNGVRANVLMVKSNNSTNIIELVFDSAVVRLDGGPQIMVSRVDGPPATATRGAIGVTEIIGYSEWSADRELAVVIELVHALDTGSMPAISPPRVARTTLSLLLGVIESHAKDNAKVRLG
ncbi:MAG: Gfo/Idh/MocA family oxidoreductase [Anaerolineae bacterium]|nr:Gfo/Idh/MocA family oxidoreductase [Anaerolineae bacterium]